MIGVCLLLLCINVYNRGGQITVESVIICVRLITYLHNLLSFFSKSWLREGKPECVSCSMVELSSCLKPASILSDYTHTLYSHSTARIC